MAARNLGVGLEYYFFVGSDGLPVALYRFDKRPETFAEMVWLSMTKEWAQTDRLSKYLIDGEVDLYTASEELAKKYFPEAFI